MKTLYMVLGLAGVMAAPDLFASMSVTLIDDTSQYSYANGGEFRAVGDSGLDSIVNWGAYSSSTSSSTKGTVSAGDLTSAHNADGWSYSSSLVGEAYFQTFCVEYNEEFTPGTSYSVGVSQNAMYGNSASQRRPHFGSALPGSTVSLPPAP